MEPLTHPLGIRAPKLTPDEQYQVCQWYAEFRTPTQIRRLIQDKYGKTLTNKNVWQYARESKKWKPMIERLRQEWALGVMDIPLAHKRARLEKLVDLLKRAEKNEQVQEFSRIQQCVVILREMRDEMEAGKSEFTNVYLTTIHNYSDEEILKQRDLVVARLKQLGGRNGKGHDGQAAIGPIIEGQADQAGIPQGQGAGEETGDQAGQPSGPADGTGVLDARQVEEAAPVLRDAGTQSSDGQGQGDPHDPSADARLRDDFGAGAPTEEKG